MAINNGDGSVSCVGYVLAQIIERNVQIMSDVYTDFLTAVVWNPETNTINYKRVRDLDAFYKGCERVSIGIDAPESVQAQARAFLADEYCRRIIARNTYRASELKCGAEVEVTKEHNSTKSGKILVGTKGHVINMGKGEYGPWVLFQRGYQKLLVPQHKVKVLYTVPVENGFMRKVAEKVAAECENFTLPEIR
jgi:hypothetical protein